MHTLLILLCTSPRRPRFHSPLRLTVMVQAAAIQRPQVIWSRHLLQPLLALQPDLCQYYHPDNHLTPNRNTKQ
jgi:hypothetical protein